MNAQPFQAREQVLLDALQARFGASDVLLLDADRDVLRPDQTAVASGRLLLKHLRVLLADRVKRIPLRRNGDMLLNGFFTGGQVHKGELHMHAGRERIEDVAPALKDGGLILRLRELVIDIVKAQRPGVMRIVRPAYAVRIHALVWNGLLGAAGRAPGLLRLLHQRGELFLFIPRQFDRGLFFGSAVFCGSFEQCV